MNKGLKIFLIVLAVIAGLSLIAFITWQAWGKKKIQEIWDNIIFHPPVPTSIDLHGATLADLQKIALAGGSQNITVNLKMNIDNKNDFSIPFSFKIRSSYKGSPLAETPAISGTIPANGTLPVYSPVEITLSGAQVQMLIEKLKGNKVTIDYSIFLSLFGIPINWFIGPITNTYQI